MSVYPARERRQPVRIGARLNSARGWSDVVIANVSSRGVMGRCPSPPARGDYVEVRCGTYTIVARVAWTGEDSFGARAQDAIALADLIASSQGRARPHPDRRRETRRPEPARRRPTPGERAAASLRFSRAFDFLSIACVAIGLAGFLAVAAHDALARPVDQLTSALGRGASDPR